MFGDLTRVLLDDLAIGRQQIASTHTWFAGCARGEGDDVGIRSIGVVIGAGDAAVDADDWPSFLQVERLPLWEPFDDVVEDEIGVAAFGDALGSRPPDVSHANNG